MALSHQDKIECKEIAREIIKEVLKEHEAICPHGLAIAKYKSIMIGICLGTGLASFTGSSLALAVAKILIKV